jgi:protein phosphatase
VGGVLNNVLDVESFGCLASLRSIDNKMKLISSAKTDVGKRRKVNQDAFLADDELGLYIVADGMGGHAAGEVAAWETVEAVHDMVVSGRKTIDLFVVDPDANETSRELCRLLDSAVQSATYMVFGMAEQSPDYHGMGTTISALLIVGNHAVTAQVGDTRIYCIRKGREELLTEDHTLINWQIHEGILTPEEAKYAPHKNVITRAVGNKDYVQVDTQILPVRVGDKFLICSDGLHGYFKKGDMTRIMKADPETACERFIRLANDRGGKDNITALVVELHK